ncbi:hypothetical protein [Nocardiopsis flavescens]
MKASDAPDPYRVFRCDLVELEPCGPRLLGQQLQVILSAGVGPHWLHSADTVAVPAPEPGTGAPPGPPAPRLLTAAEVFDRLPGCRTVVLPGPPPSVHLRGAHARLTVPDPVTAAIVAAFADLLPAVPTRALLRAAAVTAASPITALPRTAGRPAASAVLRLPGRTVRCEWRALA